MSQKKLSQEAMPQQPVSQPGFQKPESKKSGSQQALSKRPGAKQTGSKKSRSKSLLKAQPGKTRVKSSQNITRDWKIINAEGKSLGRLASLVSPHLIGKNKPDYTPHVMGGDFVVVINSDKVQLTGKKLTQKKYYRHSRYVGSLKERQAKDLSSIEMITLAVKGMLPKNKHRDPSLKRLKIFKTAQHKYQDKDLISI